MVSGLMCIRSVTAQEQVCSSAHLYHLRAVSWHKGWGAAAGSQKVEEAWRSRCRTFLCFPRRVSGEQEGEGGRPCRGEQPGMGEPQAVLRGKGRGAPHGVAGGT